jgi:putative salt-induced outer membrane protein YdiY
MLIQCIREFCGCLRHRVKFTWQLNQQSCSFKTHDQKKEFILLKYLLQILLLSAVLALMSAPANAIVNVEQAIIGKPSEGMHTSLDLLANGSSGNSNTSSTNANFLTLWQHDQHTDFLQLEYVYGKSGGQVNLDRAFAHLRHRTSISPTWAVEGFAQVGRDPFARLTKRTLLGGGMRWVMFEVDRISAGYLGFGAFYEQEILTDTLGTNDPKESNLWRANSYLVLKHQFNEQVRLYSTTYYQPGISDTADYRILEQASMLVKMAEKLDLKLSLDITFDSKPPQTVEKRDLYYGAGLEFSF